MARRSKRTVEDTRGGVGKRQKNATVEQHVSNTEGKKRKRKENREAQPVQDLRELVVEHATDNPTDAGDADGGKRKRRRKENKHEKEADTVVPTPPLTETIKPEKSEKRKKKRAKDKGKQKEKDIATGVEQPSAPIDPALSDIAPADSNAFLSAVMAAAAASAAAPTPATAHQAMTAHGSGAHHQDQATGFPSQFALPFGMGGFMQFPGFPGGSLPSNLDLSFQQLSGDDIARALSSLDIPKIADAIRMLGDAGASSTFTLPGQVVVPEQAVPGPSTQPSSAHHDTTHLSAQARSLLPSFAAGKNQKHFVQVPVPSSMILGQPLQNVPAPAGGTPTSASAPAGDVDPEMDHAHILANKWLSATKLNELAKTKGLVYKKGKFSSTEEALVKNAIENYRTKNGFANEQMNDIIFAKGGKSKDSTFWFEITSQVPDRPVVAVYHHVRRGYHPMKQQGKWMPSEDETLKKAVTELGQHWEKVSVRVGRMASDCRDRWRNYVNNSDERVMGPWHPEEEKELTQIVTEMTIAQGKTADLDVFWTQVAARMGNRRSRNQCRIKWTDALSKTVKNEGQRPRWSQQDAYILVHKIASLNVRDDSEIDWKTLPDADWNLWSAHALQRRWLTLKRGVRGYESMAHHEIMDILRAKKAHVPPTPGPVKAPRVTSAQIVQSDGLSDGGGGGGAGPSSAGIAVAMPAPNAYSQAPPFPASLSVPPPAPHQGGPLPLPAAATPPPVIAPPGPEAEVTPGQVAEIAAACVAAAPVQLQGAQQERAQDDAETETGPSADGSAPAPAPERTSPPPRSATGRRPGTTLVPAAFNGAVGVGAGAGAEASSPDSSPSSSSSFSSSSSSSDSSSSEDANENDDENEDGDEDGEEDEVEEEAIVEGAVSVGVGVGAGPIKGAAGSRTAETSLVRESDEESDDSDEETSDSD